MQNLILASLSRTRQDMLASAGIQFHAIPPKIDEEALKDAWLAKTPDMSPRDLALKLAREKALSLDAVPEKIVIAADQTLSMDGQLFNKAHDKDELTTKLKTLRGKTHHLHSAVAVAKAGKIVFEKIGDADLTMRDFSDDFLETYVQKAGNAALSSVGGYQLENLGVQLFDDIKGDYFAILGLPLLELLAFLRQEGELEV